MAKSLVLLILSLCASHAAADGAKHPFDVYKYTLSNVATGDSQAGYALPATTIGSRECPDKKQMLNLTEAVTPGEPGIAEQPGEGIVLQFFSDTLGNVGIEDADNENPWIHRVVDYEDDEPIGECVDYTVMGESGNGRAFMFRCEIGDVVQTGTLLYGCTVTRRR